MMFQLHLKKEIVSHHRLAMWVLHLRVLFENTSLNFLFPNTGGLNPSLHAGQNSSIELLPQPLNGISFKYIFSTKILVPFSSMLMRSDLDLYV